MSRATRANFITAIAELPDGKAGIHPDVETVLANTFGEAAIGHIEPLGAERTKRVLRR